MFLTPATILQLNISLEYETRLLFTSNRADGTHHITKITMGAVNTWNVHKIVSFK
jgi:hypothetical protein